MCKSPQGIIYHLSAPRESKIFENRWNCIISTVSVLKSERWDIRKRCKRYSFQYFSFTRYVKVPSKKLYLKIIKSACSVLSNYLRDATLCKYSTNGAVGTYLTCSREIFRFESFEWLILWKDQLLVARVDSSALWSLFTILHAVDPPTLPSSQCSYRD